MRWSRLFVFAFVCSVSLSPAIAQQTVRLQFEVIKDGSTVAQPDVSAILDSPSSIAIDGVGRIEFTPTLRDANLALAFDVHAGDKHLQPVVVITTREPGSISWRSDARESFKLTFSWAQ